MSNTKWQNKTNTPTYNSWRAMRNRVLYDNDNSKNHKGKGITICNEWLNDFDKFVEDMGERPDNTTLDRIDPKGNYCKSNCRWTTMRVQQNNKFGLTEIEHNGEVRSIGEWCYVLGLSKQQINTVYKRHSKYNANTYDELFTRNLYSHRKALETHECIICHTNESSKWRKSVCNNCYAKAQRYAKKHNQPLDIAGYATLVYQELIKNETN